MLKRANVLRSLTGLGVALFGFHQFVEAPYHRALTQSKFAFEAAIKRCEPDLSPRSLNASTQDFTMKACVSSKLTDTLNRLDNPIARDQLANAIEKVGFRQTQAERDAAHAALNAIPFKTSRQLLEHAHKNRALSY